MAQLNQDLLLLLDLLGKLQRDLESLGHDIRRRECEPLRQADVGDTLRLVDLDPDEILVLGGVLNVVSITPISCELVSSR